VIGLARLREALGGELFSSGAPGYEAVFRPAGAAYRDVCPRLVVGVPLAQASSGGAGSVYRPDRTERSVGTLVIAAESWRRT
jgi:hypothetical protein